MHSLVCVVCWYELVIVRVWLFVFFFQAEDGIRDLVRSRGLGDVYKRQHVHIACVEILPGSVVNRGDRGLSPQGDGTVDQMLSLIHI